MTLTDPKGHDRLGPPPRTPPARDSGLGLVDHTTVFAPPPSRTTRIAARVLLALPRCSFYPRTLSAFFARRSGPRRSSAYVVVVVSAYMLAPPRR